MTQPSFYDLRILPKLREIQDRCGYLRREEIEQFASTSGIPLHRIHAVASFFPHFRSAPPPAITVRVCRDMACHMAGADAAIAALKSKFPAGVHVEGVSCLGRCDRAPAACIAAHWEGGEDELLYLGKSAEQLSGVVGALVAASSGNNGSGNVPTCDYDADLPDASGTWLINPYRQAGIAPYSAATGVAPYSAATRVARARDAAIAAAAASLRTSKPYSVEQAERFIAAATASATADPAIASDVLAWRTGSGWADDAALANWSDAFLAELDSAKADLRGLGGAGIPATQKWRDVRDAVRNAVRRRQDDRAYIVVNGDESEPGTFKDRELLLRTPGLIVEAVVIAGLLTEATEGFIYIRHEYHEQIEACRAEIARAEELGICGPTATTLFGRPFRVSVFVSPGGYVCGEQSALIEAMSDRRSEPRNMPPKLETNGLDDQPTLVSNVETFAWVPQILLAGGQAYADMGVNGWRGRRFFSVSGDVNRPGVYEVPMGMTLRELIQGEQYCGGIKGGRALKAIAPSGPSGGFIPAKLSGKSLPRNHTTNKSWLELAARRGFDPQSAELDVLDLELELNLFRALSPTQALGAGIVVYAEGRDMVEQAVNAMEFYKAESCGKCVPCREGSRKLVSLGRNVLAGKVAAERWTSEVQPIVAELGKVMELSSICGLGRSVPVPWRTAGEFFPADLAKHLGKPGGV